MYGKASKKKSLAIDITGTLNTRTVRAKLHKKAKNLTRECTTIAWFWTPKLTKSSLPPSHDPPPGSSRFDVPQPLLYNLKERFTIFCPESPARQLAQSYNPLAKNTEFEKPTSAAWFMLKLRLKISLGFCQCKRSLQSRRYYSGFWSRVYVTFSGINRPRPAT